MSNVIFAPVLNNESLCYLQRLNDISRPIPRYPFHACFWVPPADILSHCELFVIKVCIDKFRELSFYDKCDGSFSNWDLQQNRNTMQMK